MSSTDEIVGRMDLDMLGRRATVHFPDSRYMRNMLRSIFAGKDYPILSLPDYAPNLILDIGANIGATALYFHSYFPDARIHCYEPSKESYQYLRENTKCFGNIHTHPYGLFDRSCELPLYTGLDHSAASSITRNNTTNGRSEAVRLVRASEELMSHAATRVSIVKLDTEGCEVPILRDLFRVTDLCIDMLYVEYHSEGDRLEIDRIVSDRSMLYRSRADGLHRGANVYFSKEFISRFPGLEHLEIENPA